MAKRFKRNQLQEEAEKYCKRVILPFQTGKIGDVVVEMENDQLIARFGLAGLERLKKRAWKILNEVCRKHAEEEGRRARMVFEAMRVN